MSDIKIQNTERNDYMKTREYYGQTRGCPILSNEDLKRMHPRYVIKTKMTELADHSYLPSEFPDKDETSIKIKDRLLEVGGTRIIMPMFDEDTEKIESRGQFWLGSRAIMRIGRPSQCHANSANLYSANKDKLRICTGYALSEDGIWRQHSWCIWGKENFNRIVETTLGRVLYYGFVMEPDECEEFCSWY